MNKKRILVYGFLAIFALFVVWASYPCSVPCNQCGNTALVEPNLARLFAKKHGYLCSSKCAYDWLKEHQVKFHVDGTIIKFHEVEDTYWDE